MDDVAVDLDDVDGVLEGLDRPRVTAHTGHTEWWSEGQWRSLPSSPPPGDPWSETSVRPIRSISREEYPNN